MKVTKKLYKAIKKDLGVYTGAFVAKTYGVSETTVSRINLSKNRKDYLRIVGENNHTTKTKVKTKPPANDVFKFDGEVHEVIRKFCVENAKKWSEAYEKNSGPFSNKKLKWSAFGMATALEEVVRIIDDEVKMREAVKEYVKRQNEN